MGFGGIEMRCDSINEVDGVPTPKLYSINEDESK